ncbi:hypothetical protein [Zhaonella formicivorans]|uniref:hypothetical protein n=1 Tax=Zhaonella formicivorans TaxID=2528593 RepID=UPI0010CF2CBA|nr:hypothetical protein [Zhaonella formicivorans]
MSINKLVRQSINLMEGFATMPFQIAQQLWGDESSNTGRIIKQTAYMSEQVAAMPFRFAREIFSEQPSDANSYKFTAQKKIQEQEGAES